MEFLKQVGGQLLGVWQRNSYASRAVFVLAIVVLLAVIAGVTLWSTRPHYVPLAADLAPADAAEIVSRLESNNIPYEMNFSGTSVLVPKHQWNRARVVTGGLGQVDAEVADGGFAGQMAMGPDSTAEQMLQQTELRLARSIERLTAVSSATVHIARMQRRPFQPAQLPTSASVMLQVAPGQILSREQAATVVSMVAGAVEGLSAEDVSVMDTSGRVIMNGTGAGAAEYDASYEYRRRVESELAAKANTLLMQKLGMGRASVQVTADIDFTRREVRQLVYDPESKAATSEEIDSMETTGSAATPLGVAGTGSNLQTNTASTQGTGTTSKTENIHTQYETSWSEDTTVEESGVVRRLTIAAIVDPGEAPADGSAPAPPSPEQLSALIKQAVGFDENRGDEIEVVVGTLAGNVQVQDELLQVQQLDFYSKLARASSLGLASIMAFILGVMTLRKFRSLIPEPQEEPTISADRLRVLSEFSQKARENPEAMKAVLSSWLGQSEAGGSDAGERRAA
ncbi:MAG: flagellar M-ring protein FliF [Planctomycetales bacterium]|nr:flagellar M-ring protein FliF [Planctomycetales bacterium]